MGVKDDIQLLDSKVMRLKVEYEQYFMRIIKREPAKLRDEVDRIILYYSTKQINNTSLRFKLNSVVAKYNSFKQYWSRTIREIEQGTYARRAEVAGGGTTPLPPETGPEWSPPAEREEEEAERAPAREPDKERPEPKRPAPAVQGFDPEYVRGVYDRYVEARKSCNEPVRGLTIEALARNIERNIKAVEERYKTKDVELKVAIKDGHAQLKITPKNGGKG